MSANPNPYPEGFTLPPPPPLPARPSSFAVSGSATVLDSKRFSQPSSATAARSKDQWIAAPDPRASSSQSLRSDEDLSSAAADGSHRRTLLLIYIHGFYGNKQSFRSFPHHVHSYLRSALADTHAIHSKIYPRYKTYRAIEVARDNFSEWLAPHESPTTDVILVGHSMGGILAAEIVLMPNRHPYHHGSHPYKHRILGTISLDSPFLGMHPGIIVAGISSLFQSAPEQPGAAGQEDGEASSSSGAPPSNAQLMQPPGRRQTNDPHFDPPFWNDSPFREAPFVKRIMNFTKKHRSEGIFNATANHVVSHLEYGGCLADYPGLHRRYDRIRALEDVDDLQALAPGPGSGSGSGNGASQCRVRFVNYYTLSSGRPRKPKAEAATGQHGGAAGSQSSFAPTSSLYTLTSAAESTLSRELSAQRSSVSISVADYSDSKQPVESKPKVSEIEANGDDGYGKSQQIYATPEDQRGGGVDTAATAEKIDFSRLSMQEIDPMPIPDTDDERPITPKQDFTKQDFTKGLPPIPDSPDKPVSPNMDQYTDKDARKQVEREYRRRVKAYDKAVKDRSRAIREREKLIEKRRRKAQEQNELDEGKKGTREDMDSDGSSISSVKSDDLTDGQQQQLLIWQQQQQEASLRGEPTGQPASMTATASTASLLSPLTETSTATTMDWQLDGQEEKKPEKKKKRKKFCTTPSKVAGGSDPTWVDVYMDGMDEVGAHCGLFFPGPHYDKLVGDVASRIIGWVQDDMTTRAILDLQREDMM